MSAAMCSVPLVEEGEILMVQVEDAGVVTLE
jgi:hypothetical protein